MNDVVIQEYVINHQEELIQMILTIQQREFAIAITRDDQPDLTSIPQYYQQGIGNFWVALHGTTVVGSVGLIDIGNQQVALRKMFVDAPFRGPQYAVAHSLLEVALAWANLKRIETIFLGTTDKFLAAHRFYEKQGFEKVARADLPPTFPVMLVDTVFYRLQPKA